MVSYASLVPDNSPETPQKSPFAQFEQLAKKVVSASKDRVDELAKAEKRKKKPYRTIR